MDMDWQTEETFALAKQLLLSTVRRANRSGTETNVR
jgi:hypothetical protein